MENRTRAIKLGVRVLALWTGLAAQAAAPEVTDIAMVPRLTIQSDSDTTNQIQYCTNLNQGWWLALTNLVVAESPYWFVDVGAPPSPQRFYRARVMGPTPRGMALIPAGTFTMGDCMNDGYSGNELPVHTNYVSAFYIDTNLVSYTLWQQVYQWATNNGYSFDFAGSGKAANHPVQYIDWYDVVKWCNARSENEGLVPAYYTSAGQTDVYRTGQTNVGNSWVKWNAGYRLPTEAEWEKAARGGVSGHRFPWSDAETINWSRANYYADPSSYSYDVNPTSGYNTNFTSGATPYTSPVGFFARNGYGLYDMAGNVFEWCWDWYDGGYYISLPGTDLHGPASSPYGARVLRGGTWYSYALLARCAFRAYITPSYAHVSFGLRCVRGF
jgi:formylglycine-generating enzyme required for sulfatase activity